MNCGYEDIRALTDSPPLWWDEEAVPRYCEFSPQEKANIYADECVLMHIECQGCDAAFKVCLSRTRWQTMESSRSLASFVKDGDLHYGDPPNVGCCPAGATMNSVPRRVLEFWKRSYDENRGEWHRDKSLEVAIEPEWVNG